MDSSSNRSIFMVVYLYRSQIATESFGRKLMPVGKKKCLFVFKSIETFKVIIPGLDIFLTFNLSSNLDEIFGLKISEVTKFLMIDFVPAWSHDTPFSSYRYPSNINYFYDSNPNLIQPTSKK